MLTINHDNYDTWLMLYLDNELTAAERAAVEAFAKENPAVQEELDGLRETMLQPELPVAMPGKERLLMPELWNEEALTPQQLQLLMLAENELAAEEKRMMETAISQSPLLQKEWDLLRKTQLVSAVPVEMPDKHKLFRHERTRVIPFGRVIRFAAAAAILGFGWFFAGEMIMKPAQQPGNGQVAIAPEKPENEPVTNPLDAAPIPDEAYKTPMKESISAFVADNNAASPAIQRAVSRRDVPQDAPVDPTGNQVTEPSAEWNETVATRMPESRLTGVTIVEVEGIMESNIHPIVNTSNIDIASLTVEEDKNPENGEVLSSEELTDEGTINIGGARIPKQKIRGIYRSITRPITRSLERNGIQLAYAK